MRFSAGIIRTALLILTSSLPNAPGQANAYRTEISLRIEGPSTTIFENTILTSGHLVTTASGGTHICDGTNNGANQSPGGTITTAVDDAVLTWDGTWSESIQDYFITSIAGYEQTKDKYWGLFINYKDTDKGGCQTKVSESDEVLVAFDPFGANGPNALLKATTDRTEVRHGSDVIVTVVNGVDGERVEGAVVLGKKTNAQGEVTIRFDQSSGVHKFKATKEKAIRSNEVIVTVMVMAPASTQIPIVDGAGFRCCKV
ncbi:hypothetical protein HOY80DRAFT_884510 [Tuber brumale]|nr:hypothetical protein HOY80DRAFT_884510 [Tuber brumale]